MKKVRYSYTQKGIDLRDVGAWYLVTLARDGKIDDYVAHGGTIEEYDRLREAVVSVLGEGAA